LKRCARRHPVKAIMALLALLAVLQWLALLAGCGAAPLLLWC
jgi:hypothetical protein